MEEETEEAEAVDEEMARGIAAVEEGKAIERSTKKTVDPAKEKRTATTRNKTTAPPTAPAPLSALVEFLADRRNLDAWWKQKKANEVEKMLTDSEKVDAAERQRNEECLKIYGKSAAEVTQERNKRNKKNFMAAMKRRSVNKQKQSDLSTKAYTDK